MNNSRSSIARLQIPAQSLPSTPSTVRRPSNLDPITWSRNPVLLRRPSTESSTALPHDPSSLSNLGWGQHLILPPANNTSFVTVTQGYPSSPQISPGQQYSPERIGGFPYRYQQTIDRTQSNDSGSGTGCSSADSKDYHHHGSILKGRKNGSSTVGTLRRSLSRDAEPRRVVFKNSVSVYWYDSDAESVCSPTEYERFNIEPAADDHRSRYSDVHGVQGSLMISDGESGLHRRGGVQRGSLSKKRLQETGNPRNFPDCTTPRAPPGSPVAQCKQATLPQLVGLPDKRTSFRATPRCSTSPRSAAQLSLVQDQVTLRRKLIVAVQLSPELHPYDVLVKANKNGNKIRVVISRNASLGSGSMGYNGGNEHIPLPVEIDPYQLNARLDRDGILHIEAPVIS